MISRFFLFLCAIFLSVLWVLQTVSCTWIIRVVGSSLVLRVWVWGVGWIEQLCLWLSENVVLLFLSLNRVGMWLKLRAENHVLIVDVLEFGYHILLGLDQLTLPLVLAFLIFMLLMNVIPMRWNLCKLILLLNILQIDILKITLQVMILLLQELESVLQIHGFCLKGSNCGLPTCWLCPGLIKLLGHIIQCLGEILVLFLEVGQLLF